MSWQTCCQLGDPVCTLRVDYGPVAKKQNKTNNNKKQRSRSCGVLLSFFFFLIVRGSVHVEASKIAMELFRSKHCGKHFYKYFLDRISFSFCSFVSFSGLKCWCCQPIKSELTFSQWHSLCQSDKDKYPFIDAIVLCIAYGLPHQELVS